ncbi:DegV family protein [Thermomonas sp.]|uniref:DegV family protein n=1 Tax=Thermomonas sp. TaxID=1971895 RepID=UPI0026235B5E|nr:DegV family protein [Thermomonas sp.]MCO5055526.1 DegV family EDD domain-containing protein [Thermomonas sp.]
MHAVSLEPPPVITAAALRRALIVGARRVIAACDELNRINVFPVPDGDTGNNLAATFGAVLHGALSRRSRQVGELLERVGEDAIDGARGNSGAIMAQFLVGSAERLRQRQVLDVEGLSSAVRRGAEAARAALAKPVEGTILSVIEAFSAALEDGARLQQRSPRRLFADALERAHAALAATPRQMAVLQRAGVVDAGARGFVVWLEGIAAYADGGLATLRAHGGLPLPAQDAGPVAHSHETIDPQRRYCTECLLVGEAIDRVALRAALEAQGVDSLVIAGNARRVRVHGHSGQPQRIFDIGAGFGRVEAMKADDMLRQQRSAQSPGLVAIITDSASDLPEDLAERFGIHMVPVRVSLDGRDYLDRLGLGVGEFYRRMRASAALPKTSQPPPGDFRRVFDQVLACQSAALYVGLSRPLSGTLQSAETAARDHEAKLRCFDTRNVSAGQALLAWRAGELAAAGADPAAIEAELLRLRPLTRTFAMARNIEHAVRGGRIPRWAAPLVRWTGLTPVAAVTEQGVLKVAGGLLARQRAPEAFARYVARHVPAGQRWRVIVGHADAAEDGARMLAALRQRLTVAGDHLVEIGPAIGAHAGPGTLLAGLQPASG